MRSPAERRTLLLCCILRESASCQTLSVLLDAEHKLVSSHSLATELLEGRGGISSAADAVDRPVRIISL